MALTKRLTKGSPLTAAEHDANLDHFTDLAATKAASVHTHLLASVSDMSALGRTIAARTLAADMRSDLGLGTMSVEAAEDYVDQTAFAYQIDAITAALAGKASTSHTQAAATIDDSTTIGRGILTAANAAAVRALIEETAAEVATRLVADLTDEQKRTLSVGILAATFADGANLTAGRVIVTGSTAGQAETIAVVLDTPPTALEGLAGTGVEAPIFPKTIGDITIPQEVFIDSSGVLELDLSAGKLVFFCDLDAATGAPDVQITGIPDSVVGNGATAILMLRNTDGASLSPTFANHTNIGYGGAYATEEDNLPDWGLNAAAGASLQMMFYFEAADHAILGGALSAGAAA